jgi:hypothetical protein
VSARYTLKGFMDGLFALEEEFALVHPELRVYRWRDSAMQVPCIWNWLQNSPLEQRDLSRWRDTLFVAVHIGDTWASTEASMERLETWSDSFREVIDPALDQAGPVGANAYKVSRRDMGTFVEDLGGGLLVFGFRFVIEAWLDRHIHNEPQ